MKQRISIILLLLLSAVITVAQNTPMDSIAFVLEEDNRIYTYCKVNQSDSLYFLIDTGASSMVINSERLSKVNMVFDSDVQNIGATGTSTIKASSNNTLFWGNQKSDQTFFVSVPYPNERFDGVLGLSVLRRYVVKIDYDTKLIYLYDQNNYKAPDTNKLKINYAHNVPVIEVDIETIDKKSRKLRLEVDTGSDRIIDISTSYVNKNKLLDIYKTRFATSTIASSDGNSGKIYNVYFPKVSLSKLELYKIPGGIAQVPFGILNTDEIDGMIGNWFLKRFNLTFDFKNDYLYLEPNNYLYTPFYDFLTK